MTPIYSRDALTAFVAQHAPSRACATAIFENRAVVLGGFTPAEGFPCFILQVESKHKKNWYIRVECDEVARLYRVSEIDAVPWDCWNGCSTGKRPLIDGDKPVFASLMRVMMKQWKRKRNEKHSTAPAPASAEVVRTVSRPKVPSYTPQL